MNWIKGRKEDIINVELIDVKRNTYSIKYAVRDYTPSEEERSEEHSIIPDCEYLEFIHTGNMNTFELKQLLLASMVEFDESDEVNAFFINGAKAWVSRDDRVSLMNSIKILEEAGTTEYTVWLNGISYTLPITFIKDFLVQIEQYAMSCYNVTEQHKADINALNNRNAILNYKIHTGYPPMLNFNTEDLIDD